MDWNQLLSTRRIRQLYNGRPTAKDGADTRTEFQRDYDRSLFSTPVRRLQDKAQVFPLEPHDSVRTRLTHSLEVSNVARGLARAVGLSLTTMGKITLEQAGSIELIAATCGLIHDLGNPPFGHAGEKAIQTWFENRHEKEPAFFDGLTSGIATVAERMKQDFLKFEGNAQTIRIVSRLQVLTDFYGLNLTCGAMSAACKYTATSEEAGKTGSPHHRNKPGYFASEDDLIDKIRKETGTNQSRNPITYLVEAADDIVYATVDIEDGIKKGVVTWNEIEERLGKELGGTDPMFQSVLQQTNRKITEAVIPFVEGRERDETMAQTFRTFAITAATLSVVTAFKENYEAIINGEFEHELIAKSASAELLKACKSTARECIFRRDPEVLTREIAGRGVIHQLMDCFWEGVKTFEPGVKSSNDFPSKIRSLISANYLRVFENEFKKGQFPKDYYRMLLVTDYVCGMTDSFATNLHKKLRNG